MIAEGSKLFLLLGIAGVVGYLAQRTGLCMVRGVAQFREGQPMLMLAMLLCGICIWAIVPLANVWGLNIPLVRYQWHSYFALGGVLFGLGTATNGGCAVSTLGKFARGDMHMVATMLGWIVGWCLWAAWVPDSFQAIQIEATSTLTTSLELIVLAVATLWALAHSSEDRKLWLSIMGIGLLSGFLFMLQPHWSPSSLLQGIANASVHDMHNAWPDTGRFLVMLALLTGMLIAAWLSHRFVWQPIATLRLLLHLTAGTAMGLGAAMAMGGNDAQLLLGMPSFSPAGILTVIFMLLGIYLGTLLGRPLVRVGVNLGTMLFGRSGHNPHS